METSNFYIKSEVEIKNELLEQESLTGFKMNFIEQELEGNKFKASNIDIKPEIEIKDESLDQDLQDIEPKIEIEDETFDLKSQYSTSSSSNEGFHIQEVTISKQFINSSNFQDAQNQGRESTWTSSGSKDIYIPRLGHFAHMTFLDEKDILNRSCTDTMTDEDDDETQTFQPPKVKKKRNAYKGKQEQLINAFQTLLSTKDDDWYVIGKSISLQLKRLNSHQQIIAQKLIADAIFYGKMEKLTEQSCINLSSVIHVPPQSASLSPISYPESL